MSYKVEKLSGKRLINDFIRLPYSIFRDDPNWIPPLESITGSSLDQKANPYFSKADLDIFICYKGTTPICRAITVINPLHWATFDEKTAFFGFFDSYEDKNASGFLFEQLANHCRSKGAEFIEGPFNPNHYSELGIQIPPYSTPPAFFETYNPSYYPDLMEHAGFKESLRVHTRINWDIKNYLENKNTNLSKPKTTLEFSVRTARLLHVSSDLEKIREVYNDAFSGAWHFLPLTRDEYNFSAKYLFFVTYPSLVVFIERGDKPVGVLQCMLNINSIIRRYQGKMKWIHYPDYLIRRNSIDEIVLYAVGVKKSYQGTEVVNLLTQALCHICRKYKVLSTTWMSDDNLKVIKHAEYFGLKPYKWFSIYKKTL